jgi:hypothetical protein
LTKHYATKSKHKLDPLPVFNVVRFHAPTLLPSQPK